MPPRLDPADHVIDHLVPKLCQDRRCSLAARAASAVGDDRAALLDFVCASLQLVERNVDHIRQVALLPLLRLAHIDQLRLAGALVGQ